MIVPRRTQAEVKDPQVATERVQVAISPIVRERLDAQAREMGIKTSAYATMLLANASFQVEQTRAAMPDIMKSVGSEMGKRMPIDEEVTK
jgi:hypothetical protein